MENTVYWLWLSLKVGINTSRCRELLEEYGSAEAIYKMNFGEKDILSDKDLTAAQNELDKCNEERVCVVTYADEIYPENLRKAENPPVVLYCKGNMKLLKRPLLTVAGSKKCSQDGKVNTRRFVKTLCQSNIVPVSAFSPGIEAEVCKNAEEVIAFLPCGIDKTYPAKHYSLKNKVLKNGGLVITQQPFGMNALAHNIVSRNRLIAEISKCTFIVEAGDNSGTAIMVDVCLDKKDDKKCFVIPGSIDSPFYVGSNSFIKKGGLLVTEPQDIINFYTVFYPDEIISSVMDEKDKNLTESEVELENPVQRKIVACLSGKRIGYDELVELTGLSAAEAAEAVTMLEMMGIIENTGGFFAVK